LHGRVGRNLWLLLLHWSIELYVGGRGCERCSPK
jgi:hypothetical protein